MLQVGGFLQRIDYVRKYAFGAMCILKDSASGQYPIKYAFLLRSLLLSCKVSHFSPQIQDHAHNFHGANSHIWFHKP